nr:MAG: hypothetical protein EDM05_17615 [Leptolyngbya sp. IPPAS B-1204]
MSNLLLVDVQDIHPVIVELSVIIGIFQQIQNSYFLDLDWFQNPAPALKNIPNERTNLLTLLRELLGNPIPNPPPDGRAWYTITQQGKPTPCYVVLPKDDSGTSSTIGIGLLYPYADGNVTVTPRLYMPLLALPISGNPVITGQTNNSVAYPIEIGLDLKNTQDHFTSGNVSFDGLELLGKVLFAGTGSSFQLSFLDVQPPGTGPFTTIQELLNSLPGLGLPKDWINVVLASQDVINFLNQKIGTSNETPGTLLVDMGLLQASGQASGQPYVLGDLAKFRNQSPQTLLENFFFTVLSQLSNNTNPLIPLSGQGNGIYVVGEAEGGGATDYGLRLQISDIDLTSSAQTDNSQNKSSSFQADEPTNASSPQLKLQLGQWLPGETTPSTSWLNRAAPSLTTPSPGLALYLVQADSSNTPSFHPKLELVSLGLTVQGSKDTPLVNTKGVTLAGIDPRMYVSIDFEHPTPVSWGVALRCDDLGLPLGSGLNASSSNNPVAQNLLDADEESKGLENTPGHAAGYAAGHAAAASHALGDEAAQNQDNQAVNPSFSLAAAYSTTVHVQLYDSDGTAADTVWIPIQRAFGPLHCQKIGVGWQNASKLLSFLYYGGVSLAALDIELEGLSVTIPVTTPANLSNYQFDLSGLDITLNADPVEISGGLQETRDAQNHLIYNGEAVIKAGEFSISALGSYTTLNGELNGELNGDPSLFIFAFLTDPLGGPPPCFVTGICGGFGYNRSLILPAVDQIQTFPFVAGLTDSRQVGGTNATPATALAAIASSVPPTRGEDWLAVGLQFTSFELIQSHALLVVEFGKELEIALLGLSTIKLPAEGPETFAYAELELEVVLKPAEGEFSAIAVLTPNSYVLDPSCHLTGGFAFCLWFGSNQHAGDFVLSIGGYHPQFNLAAYSWYPTLPRLGFNWAIDSSLTISGEAYFALTPSCVMGGGRLQALYQDGGLQAWFIAHADFLMFWKPFSYTASVGIDVGVAYTFTFFGTHTIKLEIGADLNLWGPPTGGTVHVTLWIVSFTIPFGPPQTPPPNIGWTEFQALLPHSNAPQVSPTTLGGDQVVVDLAVCHIRAANGLFKQTESGLWCIRADEFQFSVETAIPLTGMTLVGPNNQDTSITPTTSYTVGIRPMGIASVTSTAQVQITNSQGAYQDLNQNWQWVLSQRAVPEAMWGTPLGPNQAPTPEATLLPNRLVGLSQIQLKLGAPATPIPVAAAQAFAYLIIGENSQGIPVYLPVSATAPVINQPPATNNQALTLISQTLTNATVQAKRSSLFAALATLGVNAGMDGDLSDVQQNLGSNYQALPMVGTPDGIPT